MFHSPWFRRILCVILAVIFCCSAVLRPLEAQAVDPFAAAVVAVSIISAVVGVAQGLGVIPGPDQTPYEALAQQIATSIDPVFKYVSDKGLEYLKMYKVGDKLFMPKAAIKSILDIILSSDKISRSVSAPEPTEDWAYLDIAVANIYKSMGHLGSYYFIVKYTSSIYHAYVCSGPPSFSVDSNGKSIGGVYALGYVQLGSSGTIKTSSEYDSSTYKSHYLTNGYWHGVFNYTYSSSFFTFGDFSDELAAPAYAPWLDKSLGITLPGSDGEEDYLPVGVPPDISADWGQDKAQSGDIGISEDSIIDTGETVPVTRPGDYVDSNTGVDTPSTGVSTGTITTGISDWWGNVSSVISGWFASVVEAVKAIAIPNTGQFEAPETPDPNKFKFELKTLFPFCIPFDLYAMLKALQAEPVAPAFTLGIPFLGKMYTFQVDLSSWNGVAATLRNVQVLLFCIGLTQATRKYIRW